MTPVTAYIALGANIGNREQAVRDALSRLGATPGLEVTAASSLLENPAVGGPPGSPSFLNAVAEVRTTLGPHELLARLLEIEHDLGRVRREKSGPRTIDLDLLLYGQQVIDAPGLAIPHPRMHERRFVLAPLAEIAPDAVHPVLHAPIRELLRRVNT